MECRLQESHYSFASPVASCCKEPGIRTSQVSALLQMVDALFPIALVHLVPHQPRHHAPDPLLTDDGILCGLERCVVVVVDALEGWSNLGLLREEQFGLRSRHIEAGSARRDRYCVGASEG